MDATEVVPLQTDTVLISGQHACAAWHRGPADGRVVVKNRADADHAVRPVENLACAESADLAPVDAGELWMIFRKKAFRSGHHGHGAAKCLGKCNCLLLRARRPQLAADQENWLLFALQKGGRRGYGGL